MNRTPVVEPWYVPMTDGRPDVTGLPSTTILRNDGTPYLDRYHLISTRDLRVQIHHWHGSDDQRAMHDHPWASCSTVLAGHLIEHTPDGAVQLSPGTVITRTAVEPHWIQLTTLDAWTLFVTGPITRRWGFHTDRGWVHWQSWPHAGRYAGE